MPVFCWCGRDEQQALSLGRFPTAKTPVFKDRLDIVKQCCSRSAKAVLPIGSSMAGFFWLKRATSPQGRQAG
ncbi:Nicotinamide-nucleotide adenylyltransferase [Trichinella spiralis]|uniref:Nicotinamide-nucleotide adenylyltransferase n=1 Tax=Trichinella spiralis TaxID=6334 RepID=A0ABR3KYZ6_TRISP